MSATGHPLLVIPEPAPPDLARTLDLAGYTWKAQTPGAVAGDAWAGVLASIGDDSDQVWPFLRSLRRRGEAADLPVLLLVGGAHLGQLPQSLSDALGLMERSQLVQEALGEHIFEWFLRNKRNEWRSYKTHVTQFELDRYLTSL